MKAEALVKIFLIVYTSPLWLIHDLRLPLKLSINILTIKQY